VNSTTDTQFALKLSELVRQRDSDGQSTDEADRRAELLRSVSILGTLARISTELQADAVRECHAAGMSWASIGEHLGISRQAVQQRFDPAYRAPETVRDGLRILGPVTRDEELDHLNAAGFQGWRPVRSLHGQHVMEHDGHTWQVQRVSVFTTGRMPSERDGWQAATLRFPDCFYIRRSSKRKLTENTNQSRSD